MFESQRLRILPWTEALAPAFLELTQDPGFLAFPITDYRMADLAAARRWVEAAAALTRDRGIGKFAIMEKATGAIIGMGGLTPWDWEGEELIDITYRLRQFAWGKGYGGEAAAALVEYGFNSVGLNKITATITPDNLASKKVAQKLGMRFVKSIILKGVATELYELNKTI